MTKLCCRALSFTAELSLLPFIIIVIVIVVGFGVVTMLSMIALLLDDKALLPRAVFHSKAFLVVTLMSTIPPTCGLLAVFHSFHPHCCNQPCCHPNICHEHYDIHSNSGAPKQYGILILRPLFNKSSQSSKSKYCSEIRMFFSSMHFLQLKQ